jgi:acyl-coenzyme A thioesterase 13
MSEEHQASPFVAGFGAVLEEWREGFVRISLHIDESHTNPTGAMHGGVVTTLMDEAVGAVIASVRGLDAMRAAPHSTVDMNVSFLAAARPGDDLVVEGRVLKIGRSVAFAEAEAKRRGEDRLVAKGRFVFVIGQVGQ